MHSPSKEQLRDEFNRWAEAGRGEGMESEHLPIARRTLALMNVRPDDTILDVGCGTGWLARLIAPRVPEGRVEGSDVSNEMVRRASESSRQFANVAFLTSGAESLPFDDSAFTKAISIESAYYWPEPAAGLREIFRVLKPGGSAWLLIEYYKDNPHCHQWSEVFTIPTHLLSADEWAELFRRAGFASVAHQRIPDDGPVPENYSGRWFRDAEQYRAFRREGALLVHSLRAS